MSTRAQVQVGAGRQAALGERVVTSCSTPATLSNIAHTHRAPPSTFSAAASVAETVLAVVV